MNHIIGLIIDNAQSGVLFLYLAPNNYYIFKAKLFEQAHIAMYSLIYLIFNKGV